MNNSEQLKKVKSAFTVFTVFKFLGLATLIIGGIIIVFGSSMYLVKFFQYFNTDNTNALLDAIQVYFGQLIKGGITAVIGLILLITFSILRNKKYAKMQELKKEIENQNNLDA